MGSRRNAPGASTTALAVSAPTSSWLIICSHSNPAVVTSRHLNAPAPALAATEFRCACAPIGTVKEVGRLGEIRKIDMVHVRAGETVWRR